MAIRPSTGAVIAAANNAGTDGYSVATVGQAPPGSTFKVATSLALLRAGLTPSSRVSCPPRLVVDGKPFVNYSDYPSSALGAIDLETAVAQSCNTAFIGQRGKIAPGALLGRRELTRDWGPTTTSASRPTSVRCPRNDTGPAEAAAMIGQGRGAGVSAGHGGRGRLGGRRPYRAAVPGAGDKGDLEGGAAHGGRGASLRTMMRAVVTRGSGRLLDDLPGGPVIAKTGTAEYGNDEPRDTHAWMIAAQDDLAVAVFVQDGESGSQTAGPLLRAFLRRRLAEDTMRPFPRAASRGDRGRRTRWSVG